MNDAESERGLPRKLALAVALSSVVAWTALAAAGAVASTAIVGPGDQLRVVDASPGVDNQIRVSVVGPDFVVEDETGVSAGVGCEAASAVRVTCPQGDIGLVGVAAGGGNDEVEIENQDGAVPASMPTVVLGEDGSDTLLGGDGSDYIDGGPGLYDETNARGGDDSLPDAGGFDLGLKNGGPGSDTIDLSTATGDLVVSLYVLESQGMTKNVENVIGGQHGGRNILVGNADANLLVGGPSHDTLVGGSGDDFIGGQGGSDQVALGEGDDFLGDVSGPRGASHYVLVYGPRGISTEMLSFSDYRGSDGPITLDLETGIAEGQGHDVFADGSDVLAAYMSDFDDSVTASDAELVVHLGAGDDRFEGGAGRDVVLPGPGSDELSGGSSPPGQHDALSFIDAGPGPVPGVNASLTTGVATGHGHDTFDGFETLEGGAGFDVLEGSAGDDSLSAGGGGALMRGLDGADSIRGGSSPARRDIVDLSDRTEDLTVELPDYDEFGVASGDDEDTLFNVDSVKTGSGNDNVTGNLRVNDIETGPGDDVVAASSGADFVDGGPGVDVLDGEGGADELVGGTGSDEVLGGSEGDLIRIRDGEADSADCGDGEDTIVHDGLDDFGACETVDPEGDPVVEITDGPDPGERVGVDATWSFTVSEPSATVRCEVGTRSVECSGGTVVLDPSTWRDLDGPHTLHIRAEDFSGGVGSAERDFVLDTTPPPTPTILAGPQGSSQDTDPIFEVEGEPGTTLRCRLDGGASEDCTSGSIQYEGLADGIHRLDVTAVDEVGLESYEAASRTWTVDTVAPPAPTFDETPPAVSTARGAVFHVRPSEFPPARYSCSLDDELYEECSQRIELSGLEDGEHTLKVRQHDFAGNASAPVAHTWVVDVASDQDPPAAPTITGAPTGTVSHRSVVIEFDGEPYGEFRCSIDGAPEAPCARDRLELEELDDGTHTVSIRQVDDAGNAGPASTVEWTVDTVAPDAPTVASGPPAFTNDQTGQFELDGEPGASFRCSLDDAPFDPCDAEISFAGLEEGSHTLAVIQRDGAGNTSPETTHEWTVDLTPPAVPSVVSGPPSPSPSRDAVVVFQGEAGASWECRLDGTLRACPAGTLNVSDLDDGSHTARARVTDPAGNESPAAEHSWVVAADLESVVTGKRRVGKRRFRVRFRQDGPAGVDFVCSLGSRRAKPCSSPYRTPRLKRGKHRFRIWARSATGELEAKPSVVRLRIKRR